MQMTSTGVIAIFSSCNYSASQLFSFFFLTYILQILTSAKLRMVICENKSMSLHVFRSTILTLLILTTKSLNTYLRPTKISNMDRSSSACLDILWTIVIPYLLFDVHIFDVSPLDP